MDPELQSNKLDNEAGSTSVLAWHSKVTDLRGVGTATQERLVRLGVHTVGDLLMHLPRNYQDRRQVIPLATIVSGRDVCVRVTVVSVGSFRYRGRRTPAIRISDSAGDFAVLYAFGRPQLSRVLIPGREVLLYGRFDRRGGTLSAGRFEIIDQEEIDSGTLAPVYPATSGITQQTLRRLIGAALVGVASSSRYILPAGVIAARHLPDKAKALHCVHRPPGPEAAEKARRALAYEELFQLQFELARRSPAGSPRSAPRRHGEELGKRILERLPFSLTKSQRSVLSEIQEDLFSRRTSARLLQGDVGCGKTLVALLAAASVIESGRQVAIMVPSEALCFQHADTASRLMEPLGVRLGLLSGNTSREARAHLLDSLAAGDLQLLISTHAVLSELVRFSDLGLVVIDEQHKFGVAQRAAVAAKAPKGDLILMTATPIPRTLALTYYGDLTVSSIDEQPPGRPLVSTHLVGVDELERVYMHVEAELIAGRQAYFVCPRIGEKVGLKEGADDLFTEDKPWSHLEEADPTDGINDPSASARAVFERLKARLAKFRIGLAHARMDVADQRGTLGDFHAGAVNVLVATTVVEVGLDVPNATCMVVENAECFGLAALHQLRGRVGRGRDPSHVFFVHGSDLTTQAVDRLRAIKQQMNGFVLAEMDLELRGPGDLAGIRQAGIPSMRATRLGSDLDLMRQAQMDARCHIQTNGIVSTNGGVESV